MRPKATRIRIRRFTLTRRFPKHPSPREYTYRLGNETRRELWEVVPAACRRFDVVLSSDAPRFLELAQAQRSLKTKADHHACVRGMQQLAQEARAYAIKMDQESLLEARSFESFLGVWQKRLSDRSLRRGLETFGLDWDSITFELDDLESAMQLPAEDESAHAARTRAFQRLGHTVAQHLRQRGLTSDDDVALLFSSGLVETFLEPQGDSVLSLLPVPQLERASFGLFLEHIASRISPALNVGWPYRRGVLTATEWSLKRHGFAKLYEVWQISQLGRMTAAPSKAAFRYGHLLTGPAAMMALSASAETDDLDQVQQVVSQLMSTWRTREAAWSVIGQRVQQGENAAEILSEFSLPSVDDRVSFLAERGYSRLPADLESLGWEERARGCRPDILEIGRQGELHVLELKLASEAASLNVISRQCTRYALLADRLSLVTDDDGLARRLEPLCEHQGWGLGRLVTREHFEMLIEPRPLDHAWAEDLAVRVAFFETHILWRPELAMVRKSVGKDAPPQQTLQAIVSMLALSRGHRRMQQLIQALTAGNSPKAGMAAFRQFHGIRAAWPQGTQA